MNTSASGPAIIDLENQRAPSRAGQVVLGILGILVGTLLVKSLPWMTPIWLGPPLLAAVLADIWSLRVVRREREQLAGIQIYRCTLPGRTIHVTDEAAIKGLIRRAALWLPVTGGTVVAFLTASFFVHQRGLAIRSYRYNWFAPLLQCMPLLAAVAGIFAAVLISRAVLAWRLQQTVLRSAHVPHTDLRASTTFVLCTLLSFYVLGGFGQTAYQALKPVPPQKTIGDLIFSSLSPTGTFLIEHRESLSPNAQVSREIYIADPRNPSARTLLHGYARAATVSFSPDESRLMVSEKKDGSVRPLFMVPLSDLRGSAMGFVHAMRENRTTVDQRLRTFYSAPSDRAWLTDNIWVGEWATEADAVAFLASAKDHSGKEPQPDRLFVWDYMQNTFAKIEQTAPGQKEALKSFLAERARKSRDRLRQRTMSAVKTRIAAENRRDADRIGELYAPVATYLDEGPKTREAIQAARTEAFRQWEESSEVIVGDIETEPMEAGKWRAKWKTNAELRSPERHETLKQNRAYDCEFIDQKGQFLISKETMKVLKEEKLNDPTPSRTVEAPRPQMIEKPVVTLPAPSTPKPLKFPEGTWAMHRRSQEEGKIIFRNNVITVRGTSFQYDVTNTQELTDPINNPFQSPKLRGLKRIGWTEHYSGTIIRSDPRGFTVKIASVVVRKRIPENLSVDPPNLRGTPQWFFGTRDNGIFDTGDPSSFFERVESAPGR